MNVRRSLVIFLVGFIASSVLSASCDKMPLVAPSGSALTLIAAANVLPVNGATDVSAVILEGAQGTGTTPTVTAGVGTPVHDGTLVTFTTTLGKIEPVDARTKNGRATVRLIADGRSGTATITAFSGPASSTLDVAIGAAGATRVAVTANPQSLPATGGTTTISARVEDQQGNGLLGVPVSFSTTKGTLSNTNVLSNDHGFATTELTTTAEATVTASTGGAAAALTGTVLITLKPATTISVTPPTTATLGVPASFSITPGTTTIITDVTVDFGDGSTPVSLGSISGATNVSHLYRRSGEHSVIVRATDSDGGSRTVSTRVVVGPLGISSATSSPNSATTPKANDLVTLTVTPAAAAIVEAYEWNFGDGTDLQQTANGQITHRFAPVGTYVVVVRVFPFGSNEASTALITVEVKP